MQDINEKDPLHWVHIIVFGLVVIVVLHMLNTMGPVSVLLEDPNSIELQVETNHYESYYSG